MMGTLAAVLAGKDISTPKDRFRAHVRGDIENVDGVLKITHIHVHYFLKAGSEQKKDAEDAFKSYLSRCPAAQSVTGCIELTHELSYE